MYEKNKARIFYPILFYSNLFLFVSCDTLFNEPVRDYFDYWSSTCQVAKVEFSSAKTTIDGVENLSAKEQIQIDVFAINPKGFKLLQKTDGLCFSLQNSGGTLSYSDYSETQVDSAYIKITAKLTDASEGETITLSGGLYPENRIGWTEAQLRESVPELFTSVSFIQNTPPDNIKNMTVPEGDDAVIDGRHYVSFEVPNQDLNRNKDSTYEIKYYLNEGGSLNYKGSRILTLDDNKGTSPKNFIYYFDDQEPSLYYDYTVQVIGPRGLRSEIFSTASGLGVLQVSEPVVTVSGLNGLKDDEGFECVEVENESDIVSFAAVTASGDDTLTVTLDGSEVTAAGYRVSGTGRHTIVATSSRDGYRPISVTKKIRIVKTQKEPEYAVQGGLKVTEETGGDTYIEAEADTVVSYTITAESGCTLTVKNSLGNTSATSSTNAHTLILASLNSDNSKVNNLTVIVKKQYCTDKTFARKVTLVKAIQEPTIRVYKNSGNDVIDASSSAPEDTVYSTYTCYDLPLTVSGTGNANFELTLGSGESVSVKIDGITSSAAGGKYTLSSLGPHTITLELTKANCTTKTFTKNVYIQGILRDPTLEFKAKDSSGSYKTVSQDGTDNGYPLYKFSYFYNVTMQLCSYAGNSENAQVIKVDGTQVASGGDTFSINGWLKPDTTPKITIVQTRPYCKTNTYERTISVKIKPVTITINYYGLKLNFDESGKSNVYGNVYMRKNNGSWDLLRNFDNAEFGDEMNWDSCVYINLTYRLTSPLDTIAYKSVGLYESDGKNKDWIGDVEVSKNLQTLKTETAPQLYVQSPSTGGSHPTEHLVKLTLTE